VIWDHPAGRLAQALSNPEIVPGKLQMTNSGLLIGKGSLQNMRPET
jgi:hypothetical protein